MKLTSLYFPPQRVSDAEKAKPSWYESCIDYVISMGIACNDKNRIDERLNILRGNIPDEYYKKVLNPYNSNNERYTRFPATMRNLDIMNDIVRRYVSEYIKAVHEFVVVANNPDIVLSKNTKLREAISLLAQQTFAAQFQAKYQEQLNQGIPEEQINPQELMPNIDEFIKDFEENYIDDISAQGQALLDVIDTVSESDVIYPAAYFNFVVHGECYSYRDVRDNKFIKEIVPVDEAFPIPTSKQFREDDDMFARKMLLTYQQIVDIYDEFLSDKDREFLRRYYGEQQNTANSVPQLLYSQYFESYPQSCEKLTPAERDAFKRNPIRIHDVNNDLIEVWHVVWAGEKEVITLTYQNAAGFIDEMIIEDDNFKFSPELGHIKMNKHYVRQVYEGVRIGLRYGGIYPIKARAVAFNRDGKLPYNGISEILPTMGKFSIVDTVLPFQILRNIISYHREMVMAKNKMLILIIAESLLGSGGDDTEDKIYKMAADGVLPYDDSVDANGTKANNIRLLNANLTGYIQELTNLMDTIKYEAREIVDMTPQRYGEIAQSAQKGTTQEAIVRGSMGSVVLVYMFDKFRERDYASDMDHTKLAWIDGLNTTYRDSDNKVRYLSLDVNAHTYADYCIRAKNNAKETDKLAEAKNWAFSAAQNGDIEMAFAAINSDNMATMKKAISRFTELKQKHEDDLQQAQQILEQSKIENKLKEIAAKGEEDRKTLELEKALEINSKYVDVNLALINSDKSSDAEVNAAKRDLESTKARLEADRNNIERFKVTADTFSKAADRKVKREQMANDYKIAKANKNKYDK